jgi:uncharacterized protein with LGFP repeats
VDPAVRQHHQGRDAAPHRRFEQLHRRPGPAILRSTYTYHAQSLGWGDIGYNVLVDKFGRIWEGRSGGLASTVVGAHAGGFNTSTFGVSMMGNYDVVGTPQPMIDSVAAIIGWKFSLYGVNPRGRRRSPRAAPTSTPPAPGHAADGLRAHRHQEHRVPGRYGYARLGEIRDKAAARMANTKSPIATRYDSDAGSAAWLGAPVGGEQSAAGVTWQVYARGGRLYSSPAGGVRLVVGGILDGTSRPVGRPCSGRPVSDDAPTPGGRRGLRPLRARRRLLVPGDRLAAGPRQHPPAWLAAGGATGGLGFPTTSDAPTPEGRGYFVRFQRGDIYWSQATGARTVLGSIRDTWQTAGGTTGFLGFPTTSDTGAGNGAFVRFQGGDVYWSPTTGTRIVRGNILDAYRAAGGPTGGLGFPTTSDAPTPEGRGYFVRFQGGDVYWSQTTGARVVVGAIRDTWLATGGPGGYLGFPTTSDTPIPGKGAYVRFQGGDVYWSPTTGTRIVRGEILNAWLAAGGATGYLGFPTTSDAATADGRGYFVRFQGGDVYWSPRPAPASCGAPSCPPGSRPVGRPGRWASRPRATRRPRTAAVRSCGSRAATCTGRRRRGRRSCAGRSCPPGSRPVGRPGRWASDDERREDRRRPRVRRPLHRRRRVLVAGDRQPGRVGAMARTYWQRGGSSSTLGFPTRSSYAVSGGMRTDFEHGSMTWNATSGAVAVSQ